MIAKRVASLVVVDKNSGTITVDGEEMLPANHLAEEVSVDGLGRFEIATVTFSVFADNILVTERGDQRRSPTAKAEGIRIVRDGLADVLKWLGESP